jgi:hypothetical protein
MTIFVRDQNASSCAKLHLVVRSGAFTATMYNKIFSGHKPCQMVLNYPEDEDRDGPRNVGFFAIQPFDAAGTPRRFYLHLVVCIT